MAASYILVLSQREALVWVVRKQRMAFAPTRIASALQLRPGDRLFLYAARSAFNSPTRDRGRLFGEADVITAVSPLREPMTFGGRAFTFGCSLDVHSLVEMRTGVELSGLIGRLEAFPDGQPWAPRLRRTLVPLPGGDAEVIHAALAEVTVARRAVLDSYRVARYTSV